MPASWEGHRLKCLGVRGCLVGLPLCSETAWAWAPGRAGHRWEQHAQMQGVHCGFSPPCSPLEGLEASGHVRKKAQCCPLLAATVQSQQRG